MDTNKECHNEVLLQSQPSEAIAKGEPLLMSGPNPPVTTQILCGSRKCGVSFAFSQYYSYKEPLNQLTA
jgi:hypothetical protein